MSARDTFNKIRDNARREFNAIPSKFERYRGEFLGVFKSVYFIITASSGIGKSRFAKWAFMFIPFQFIKANPDCGIRLKIFYFSLEENKDKFVRSVISSELYRRHGIVISPRDLLSYDPDDRKITPEIEDKIEEILPYIDELLGTIEVIDHIRNPYGIYKHVREYARDNGKFYFVKYRKENDVEIEVSRVEVDPRTNPKAIWNKYEPSDPDEIVIVITDPVNLLEPEEGQINEGEAMGIFSKKYCLLMRDKLGYCIVNVQQQAPDKEKQEYTYAGKSVESKLEPSLDGLGDNKRTARDADFVYGLFAPDRYEIKEHRGYNIEALQDKYRQLKKLKDRDGEANSRIGLYFQGAVNEFSELPPANDFKLGLASYNDYI